MSDVTLTGWRSPRRVASTVLIILAAFALVWIGRASAQEGEPNPAAAKSISTAISKVDAVDTTDRTCTDSASFIDVPGMLVSFKSGGTASRPVIVLFQGRWSIASNEMAAVRLTIDGVVQSGPADVLLAESSVTATHGFNFLSDRLAPGLHVARIQWRSAVGAGACVQDRSLIVMHK